MNALERFQAIMNFKPFDRLPVIEWAGWWDQTLQRWYQEGAPQELTDRYDICRHFGLDIYRQEKSFFTSSHPGVSSGPLPLPVATEGEYDKIRPYLYPADAVVDAKKWEYLAEERRAESSVFSFKVHGFFWHPRSLLGIERHLYAFYDQPGLMHRINTDQEQMLSRIIDEVCPLCAPDYMVFSEDLSYNHGPMLSQELFEQFIAPYYARIIPKLKKYNIVPFVDSDGDVSIPAHWFEKAGIEGILPLERQAGVDIARLREEHSKMRFMGHFDKMKMSKGEAAIRAEFERLLPAAAKGGFIISCDHQTPPQVSYADYRLYVSLFHEYAREAGRMSQNQVHV
ncbi:MAG: uroporphyrinogen decarboxylase family protein [Kiritimatiellae bacterium]|nr:uroporphyrinogen decarboxylase family protein [Kiritimatiellia bacterium]